MLTILTCPPLLVHENWLFFFEKWFKFCVKIGFEVENLGKNVPFVRFASTFNVVRVAVLTYDLVICKDSNDCLAQKIGLLITIPMHL